MSLVTFFLAIIILIPCLSNARMSDSLDIVNGIEYNFQGEFQHRLGLNFLTNYISMHDLYFSPNTAVYWTYDDKFAPKNKSDDNVALSFMVYSIPIHFLYAFLISDENKSDSFSQALAYSFAIFDSQLYYFPNTGDENRTLKERQLCIGFYAQNNMTPYIFHRNKWISFKYGGGLSFVIHSLKLNIGFLQHLETDFSENFTENEFGISVALLGNFLMW